MAESFRETYFLAVRMGLLLILEIYLVLTQSALAGASAKTLLLLAFFIGASAAKEFATAKWKWTCYGICILLCALQLAVFGKGFLPLAIYLCYEILSWRRAGILWYLAPFVPACAAESVMPQLLFTLLLGMIYAQHDFVVLSWQKQAEEDTLSEQHLKRDLHAKENEMQVQMERGLLQAENRLLEERARLSQTLHDKLGHNINGSIYQLEAVKVLLEREPERAGKMLQAVIDELRTGMDEIRIILRKERPEKYRLAVLQIEKLCEECRQKGIEAEFITEGDLSKVPEKHLETILDNAYEAVSNSLRYAGCTRLTVRIHVMNRMVRCSILDNGVGCKEIVDGMGISGMRQRIREMNGILDFESEDGFSVNMLLPL